MKFNLGDHAFYIQSEEVFKITPVVILDIVRVGEYMVGERGVEEPDFFTATSKELFSHPRAIQKAREFIGKN